MIFKTLISDKVNHLVSHIKIVYTHRTFVRNACFRMGLIWQGLVHDLSKYSITELLICKFYSGTRSPHQNARQALGYSPSWIHHYHNNKHHFQYWWDENEEGTIIPMKMPYKYVIESFCDMLGASKAYNPKDWQPKMLLDYWQDKCVGKRIMHKASTDLVDLLIRKMAELGEEEFFSWYDNNKYLIQAKY